MALLVWHPSPQWPFNERSKSAAVSLQIAAEPWGLPFVMDSPCSRVTGSNPPEQVGFRARYEFVDEKEWSDRPNARDCDEFLEGYGGESNWMAKKFAPKTIPKINTYVDCIWIIGRFPHMARTFDRIYLKIEEFHMKGVGLRLEIREGASSTSDRLLLLFDSQTRDQVQHKQPRHGFATTSSTPAFYIRLRGYLMGSSGLEIVYTQFYRWATALCPGVGEFHCDNARCIKATLRCDGTNHCGDGSDEHCQRPISDFKQPDTDVSGLIALVIGVCGLILLIISTTAVMGRFYRRRLAAQLNGTDLSAPTPYSDPTGPSIQTVGERRFYVVPESQISVIEAPPSYDDALKHPPVPSSRTSAFLNRAYVNSASEVRQWGANAVRWGYEAANLGSVECRRLES
ncbi:Low-density lipoprotein receptor domain class A, partial [Cooperia oncophora]